VTKKKPSQSNRRRPTSKPVAAKKKASGSSRATRADKAKSKVKVKVKAKRPPRPPSVALPAVRPIDERNRRDSLANAKIAIAAALDKKAVEPVLIDVCGRASYADFIAVVSGRSDRQVDAIADGVCTAMAVHGRRPLGREGARNGRWVLIDFGDVVMHVFYHPLREVFDIESLWIDAPRVKLNVPAEARADAGAGRESGS
jgi:ribosome-associated protein